MPKSRKALFFAPSNKRLSRIISIKSPAAFRRSIKTLKKDGLTVTEKKALVLAQNRARAQLARKNLSLKEIIQMRRITRIKLPPIRKRRK